jgi:hypothetical protein
MFRVSRVRGIAVCAFLLCSISAFAVSYTSTQSGNWNQTTTWGGAGVPASGDDVTITSNHVVTVTDARVALSVTLDSTAGNKMLVVDSTGFLLVESAVPPAIAVNAPSPGSTNIVRVNGGILQTSDSGISITGGTSASKLEFTSLGGTAKFDGDVTVNSIFDVSSGTLRLNGSSAQTVNVPFSGLNVQNLELNNLTGASVTSLGTTIDGSLLLNGGNLTVSGTFTIDVLASVTRNSGWIVGAISMGLNPTPARTFHVGTSAAYLPVSVDADIPGLVTVAAVEGKHPNRTGPNVLDRYWQISTS